MSSALPQNPIETIDLVGTLAAGGSAVDVGGNHPFLLDDPDSLWVVLEGEVDVFSVRLEEGGVIHDRRHLFTVEAGQMIWSLGRTAELPCWGLLAAATPSSAVYRTRYVEFCALLEQPFVHAQAAALIERWATALAGSLTESLRPKTFVPVTVGQVYTLAPSSSVSSDGGLVWVEHLEGTSHWRGNLELPAIAQPAIAPLSARTWIQAVDAVRLRGLNTHMLLDEGKALAALDHLHRILAHHIDFERQRQLEEERRRIEEQREADRRTLSGAIGALSSLLAGRGAVSFAVDTKSDPLYAACKLICEHLGVPIGPPPPPQKKRRERDPLASFDASSYLRTRRVVLRGAWWRGDHGPLLAYLVEGRQPVALLPTSPRSYELHDVRRGTRAPVDEVVASSLAPFAITFYRRFPTRALEALDLLRFGLQGCGPDLITIGLMGLAIGLLALVTPLVTGLVFDTIIPGAQRQQLIALAVGLAVGAGAATLFEVVRGFAILRVEGKLGIALQAAVWDRLVDLPARFFRDYAAGELATRAFGIDAIRRNLSAHTVTTLMASLFGLFNAALLFYYDTRLAAYGMLLVLFAVLVTAASGAFHLHLQRSSAELQGRISALVLQLLNGIAKLRIAGAETRAFARWAELFRQQRLLALKTRAPLQVFGAFYPILAALVLYLAISRRRDVLSTGDFVAFIAAFTTLLVSTLQSCTSILSILGVAPTYRRLRPILETVPEIDTSKGDPGELDGEIEVVHLSFRYSDDGPAILTDVNLHIKPGEFVALVGPSGSGKSTLLRLLLGFERPSAGTIYYSGQDLGGVDVREIRRQIGVVLQNGQLLSGDIFSNIVGAANLTMEDAVEAARLAGLDKDLAAMPMGMRTVVSESSSTLSGGQRQRLLIARAIVRKPRILLFDEATSALDNRTQAIVSESIGRLEATRVVIAHRLSTIVHADRIVVLEAGRVVQVGTYEELMARPGPFVELAKRQLT